MHIVHRKDSLYVQLLLLMVISAIITMGIFSVMNSMNDRLLDKFFYASNYGVKKDSVYVNNLQQYIYEKQICSRDTQKIKAWVKKQKIIRIRIYKDNIEIFDSDYPDKEMWEEDIAANEYEWETYYTVQFADGTARIGLIGYYEFQLYNYMLITELIGSFLVFLFIVLYGIRKKISYIAMLYDEIKILEGGSLNYVITLKGQDELAALAEGLNNLRLSFLEMLEREADVINENSRIITEMSHDLRTPITSILLYTEILKKNPLDCENKSLEYINKIEQKAYVMKQLTNHLFEYSLVSSEVVVTLEEPEYADIIFSDMMSEMCKHLYEKGYQVEYTVSWEDVRLQVYTEYIVRIFDNILTNILKYADRDYEITISSSQTHTDFILCISNRIKRNNEKLDSNGVGTRSIANMMKKMNGRYSVNESKNNYQIFLEFPICRKDAGSIGQV